jgi:ubiquitin C-terminal hydrolase
MKKAKDKTLLYRDVETVKKIVQMYKDMKLDFCIKNSSYSTIIETETNQVRFITNNYSNAVFMAAQKIKSDVTKSELGKSIMAGHYSTANYDSANGQPDGTWNKIINIDITSAYATCLLNSKLISKETYLFLQKIPKTERLPAMGMLARNQLIINFEKGVATTHERFTADTAQIFFYVISEINKMMQKVMQMAGDYFLFYWVDGIFLKYDIPVELLDQIEAVFLHKNYAVKYESVKDLEWKREDESVVITMNKNGENKRYAFKDRNYSKNFDTLMQQFIARNPFKLPAADLAGLERSANFAEIDTFLQMEHEI